MRPVAEDVMEVVADITEDNLFIGMKFKLSHLKVVYVFGETWFGLSVCMK